MDIASYKLDGNADAVEFCPNPSLHHILAAATYTLHQDMAKLTRFGSISLFSATASGIQLLHLVHTAGVFDIKWKPVEGDAFGFGGHPLLAQADADGFLSLYSLHPTGISLIQAWKEKLTSSMCLCVDWSPSGGGSLSSGLSDGCVSTVAFREDGLQISQQWQAHEHETWATLFDSQQQQLLYTGSDDCCLCCWDLRHTTSSPAFRNAKSHKMGVCCIAQSPADPNTLLTGSYDEFLRVWDVRSTSRPVVEKSLRLGGGVWRLRHHPCLDGVVLAACMHNGFAVVRMDGESVSLMESYHKHESLAYGGDWQRGENGSSLVASCSFYDRVLRIWQPLSLEGKHLKAQFVSAVET